MSEAELLWPGGPRLLQAAHFRLGTDCVLLADFVNTSGAKRGIDLGCASGALMLLLLERAPGLCMTGLEIVPEAASLARENMALNGFETRGEIVTGDIREYRALFRAGSFDLVVCNPPYFPQGSGALPSDADRAAARSELLCTLPELCAAAAYLLHTGGRAFFVHRPERLSELLVCMTAAGLEPKRLRLVCSDAEKAPSLVLVEGRRGGKPGLTIEPSLYLYDADGSESAAYKRIYHR
ncbi:MAG: methyltransferase [Oscillospiraceae bacterium]|nr:methyltransferase [Oscillospiraceae bacterium]MBQ6927373.1 methyltransferase [Oscillospiraceae bacterium]